MRLPLKLKRADEEKLLFDMAARSAQKRLVLIASRLEEASDRERIPSDFFLRVAASLRGTPVGLRELAAGSVPGFRSVSLENPAPPVGELPVDRGEVRLRLVARDPGSARVVLKLLAGEEAELIRRPLQYDDARWESRLTAFDGRLSDMALVKYARELIGPGAGPASASRLESYAKCPYLFFLQRVMGLVALEEPDTQLSLDPLVRGEAIHSILERFLREFSGELFAKSSIEDLETALQSIAGATLDNIRPPGMQELLWEIERRTLEQLLANWLRFEKTRAAEGLLPAYFERPFGTFGPGEAYPDLPIQAGKHRFVFRGRIDRIDISADGRSARVIDYKTGRLPETMNRRARPLLMAGEKMQVALYPLVLPLLGDVDNVASVAGEFLHLQPKDGEIVPCSFDPEVLQEAARRLPEILAIIGDGLEDGIFFARSAGTVRPHGHCRWCDFLNICGKDRIRREERKSDDPAVVHFGRLAQLDPASGGE
jgi:RecB family exonuclease